MNAGIIGGIIGTLLGVLGGAIGTYCSIKNTKGPKERAFMIKASVIAWLAITLFVIGLLLVPDPYRLWLWIPHGILLPLGIMKINQRIAAIRRSEDSTR